MFLEASDFPFIKILESHWRTVQEELFNLEANQFVPWHEKHLYNKGWSVYGLYAFGKKIKAHCSTCPKTTEIIEKIPNLFTAGFSVLSPKTHVKPHRGYSNKVLRCHLGLVIPQNCSLRVAGVIRSWQERKCLIFDDTALHEAWNHSDSRRVVLLIDFRKDAKSLDFLEKIKNFVLRYLAESGHKILHRDGSY